MLVPRKPVPELSVMTVDGDQWMLHEQTAENFIMIAFYRGLHCPKCKLSLTDLNRRMSEFRERGVNVIAISGDTLERAQRTKEEWGLENVKVGYGLSIEKARQWGLFISTSRGKTSMGVVEPDLFS
jgi:peroxiredoxin